MSDVNFKGKGNKQHTSNKQCYTKIKKKKLTQERSRWVKLSVVRRPRNPNLLSKQFFSHVIKSRVKHFNEMTWGNESSVLNLIQYYLIL